MSGVFVRVGPITGLDESIEGEERRIEGLLIDGVEDVLIFTGRVQAESYTASGNPPPPPGSTYVRTFETARSSSKRLTRRQLPIIAGEWFADLRIARYAELVIGPRSQQAGIHRGRWKSEEDVEQIVAKEAPGIIQEKFR